jgi:hypothetical protein
MIELPFRYILMAAIVSLTAFSVRAETINVGRSCSYVGANVSGSIQTFAGTGEAVKMVNRIVSASGLQQNFQVRAGGVQNASAISRGADRFIVYNPNFINDVLQRAGTDWAAVSIMAHEVGHHLNNHGYSRGNQQRNDELFADYFSGFILQKLGATIDEAKSAMRVFGAPPSRTHPGKEQRFLAINNGWNYSCQLDNGCKRGIGTSEKKINKSGVPWIVATGEYSGFVLHEGPDQQPYPVHRVCYTAKGRFSDFASDNTAESAGISHEPNFVLIFKYYSNGTNDAERLDFDSCKNVTSYKFGISLPVQTGEIIRPFRGLHVRLR